MIECAVTPVRPAREPDAAAPRRGPVG